MYQKRPVSHGADYSPPGLACSGVLEIGIELDFKKCAEVEIAYKSG